MSIIVDGTDVSVVHVRHDGRSYGAHTEDIDDFNGSSGEFLSLLENHFDFSVGSLSGYELDIIAETGNAVARPQAKFGA